MSTKKVTDNKRTSKRIFFHLVLAIGAGYTTYISSGFYQIAFGFISLFLFCGTIGGYLNMKIAVEDLLISDEGLWTLAVLIVIATIMIYFNII